MSDSVQPSRVVVKIFGEDYPITGSGDAQYISRVADLVDTRMKEVAKASRSQARDKVAILTAMSIASELYEARQELEQSSNGPKDRIASLIARLDEALASADTA